MMKKMKNGSFKLLSQATIFSLLMSVACTHQEKRLIGEEDFAGEESSQEVASGEASAEGFESGEQAAPSEDLTASTSTTTEATDVAAAEETLSTDIAPVTDGSTDLSAIPTDVPADTTASLTGEPELIPASPTDGAALAANTESLTDATATEVVPTEDTQSADTQNVLPDPAVASNPDTLPAPAPEKVKSTTPAVPNGVVKKGNQALNRYYFLRHGDTPASLSQLFYGNGSHEAELVKWNGKASSWKVGSMIFYISADQPDDTQLDSFYNEQGVAAESYTVKAGDQLSSIAQGKYGSFRSWKEIAINNKLENPDVIAPGQTLMLMPLAFTSAHEKSPETAKLDSQAAPVAANDVKVLTEDDQEAMEFAKVEKSALPEANVLPSPNQMEKSKDANLAAMELGQPESSSNFYSFALGAGILMLALFLFMVRRARNRARAEFME